MTNWTGFQKEQKGQASRGKEQGCACQIANTQSQERRKKAYEAGANDEQKVDKGMEGKQVRRPRLVRPMGYSCKRDRSTSSPSSQCPARPTVFDRSRPGPAKAPRLSPDPIRCFLPPRSPKAAEAH
ncbi:uncharacterized protein SPSK_06744 [Sporothrix schenckii 1099-18]|uniref:Uncharacterized protein n=1 Tax=Sporothrix schenckii 1099-18 TaxID=1397361 RepID=A0A0F2MIC7_SPOSC|nr:uncharacterized protein SPSK_06744 [Sporothrix schenckii 1099-18]KJR89397.1 hypothetical protein SPSK_06744 [Sporothrix schenckii 1099-18]